MDLKSIGAELGLEKEEFLEIVELFLETAAQDATHLKEAIARKDFDLLAEASHSLKGSAGNLGFLAIYTLSKEMEEKARELDTEGLSTILETITAQIQEIEKAAAAS